ncbi:molybdate ABC transporter substrate-binding protein [Skermanella mucosa]|uniref:molybdate ABC transporter substrate-binding protein n=1 Tax=Skermanella mucosa TaxID=1789672 RepID=UPI001E2908D6|nr:molybdate ABC transporter substrate-binding protein [Skermanella mucosa]UEM19134.1 molybdate ABC transporter substrate-binding protein [Skermanella mucosa]
MRLVEKLMGGAVACLVLGAVPAKADDAVRLFAAGSLKAALTELAKGYESAGGPRVEATFGPSGQLRARLEKGEAADLFASANLEHPQALADAGLAAPVRPFARNELCALAQPHVAATPDTLLDRLLDPEVRVATSTPRTDPAGDYAWELFGKAEALHGGSAGLLRDKALQLTGGPESPKPPAGRTAYGWLMAEDRADIFLTYCTNARLAVDEVPDLKIVAVPEPLAVGAVYGLAVITGGDTARGTALADHILSPAGQAVLERYGFSKP